MLFNALHVAKFAACLTQGCKDYPQHVDCRFQIEHLSAEHETQQSGAEGNSGFSSAQAIQEAIHAGATCIGRTNTPEIALGYVIAYLSSGSIHYCVLTIWDDMLTYFPDNYIHARQ